VFLVHGVPKTMSYWRHIVPLLTPHYTVIALDNRGCGGSQRPPAGYDTATMAGDVAELATYLGFDQFRVAGEDWGAAIAYAVAAFQRYLTAPHVRQHRSPLERAEQYRPRLRGIGVRADPARGLGAPHKVRERVLPAGEQGGERRVQQRVAVRLPDERPQRAGTDPAGAEGRQYLVAPAAQVGALRVAQRRLRGQNVVELVVQDRRAQILLVLEVVVQLRLPRAASGEDVVHRGRGDALGVHQLGGRVQDGGPGAPPSFGGGQ
jgi:pimeloyl-ACP methyl ester carboxylesterase